MKPLPKIARIIKINPFQITLLWNTAEIRFLDFAPLFEQWETEGDTRMAALQNWEVFQQVTLLEHGSLSWPNIPVNFTYKGETRAAPLELDALELYRQSVLVRKTGTLHLGAMLLKARKAAGLSQENVALFTGRDTRPIKWR